jgi:hypothetical protein
MNLSKSMSNGTMLTFFLELPELDLLREERIKKCYLLLAKRCPLRK